MTSDAACNILAVIPARYKSTRFPGKVIAPLAGKPLVVHVAERTAKASLITKTVIATDDSRVAEAAEAFGITVVMTRPDHRSGTDRIAEVARSSDASIVVNVQGDEPLIDPAVIDATIQPLLDRPEVSIATARHLISDPAAIQDPNVVKVVCDEKGRALYFSRSPIPCIRDASDAADAPACHWQHVGLYVYRREFLMQYSKLPATPLEKLEKLEQLRALENGYTIVVVDTPYRSIGVDTPEDLERARCALENELVR